MVFSWRIWLVYTLLLAVAVPWYWRWLPWGATTLVMGMPLWAFTAIVASAAVSIYTAWLLRRRWSVEDESPPGKGDA